MLDAELQLAVRHLLSDRLVVFSAAAYIGRSEGQGWYLMRFDLSFGQGLAA